MVEMINRISGTHMWVAKSRVAEYLKAGHKVVNHDLPKAPKKVEPVEDFMNAPVEPVAQDEKPVVQDDEPVKKGRGRKRK